MKAVKELREKELGRGNERPVVYSTSEGRAHFADVLQATSMDKAIIGFDRYGRSVAALVPIEAIRMLAGRDDQVSQDEKRRIKRMAQLLLSNVPERTALVPVDVYREKEAPRAKRVVKKKRTRSTLAAKKAKGGAKVKR
ncbi:MAG: hypothetical protein AB7J28_02805 [Hyphomonadaceae bacterium]